jgi:hypothetical protein
VHERDSLCKLWHMRMDHLHQKELLIFKEIIIGLLHFNVEQHGVCRGCTLGKHAKVAFPRRKHRSKEILDLVEKYKEQEAPKVAVRSLVISIVVQQLSSKEGEMVALALILGHFEGFVIH